MDSYKRPTGSFNPNSKGRAVSGYYFAQLHKQTTMLSLRDISACSSLAISFVFIHFTAVAMTATIKSATATPRARPSRPGDDTTKSGEYVDEYTPTFNEDFSETYSDCPDCELQEDYLQKSLTPNKIKTLRLEMIKKQILNKLQMKHRPNITLPKNMLPTPLSEDVLLSDEKDNISWRKRPGIKKDNVDIDDFYAKTTQVAIFADQGYVRCHNKRQSPSTCFRFHFTKELENKEIHGAQLWVYKLANSKDSHNHTFAITELSGPNKSKSKNQIIATLDTYLKTGWIKFDVKLLISKWVKKTDHSYYLEVICKTCSTQERNNPVSIQDNQRPFLVINTAENSKNNRHKRSLDCSPGNNECCRESFYVSFKLIGWNDWIIQPEGYRANYCRGSCRGTISPMYHHTSVMQRVALSQKDPDRQLALTPCCSPTRMSRISLIYFSEDQLIVKKDLPNMVVEACGCS